MSFVKDIGKTVAGFAGAAGSGPSINAPTFRGVTTDAFRQSAQGVLARSTGSAGRLVPNTEANLLGDLEANRAGIRGLAGNIPGLRAQIDPLRARGEGFFNTTAGLRANLTGQLDELRPGFGRLTQSRVQGVRAAASKASGNLRSNFAQRNVAGASFANAQIASIQQDFANEEDRVRAESFIQEQQAQQQIIAQIGGLLQLDQASLNQQAQLIGAELGLTQAEAGLFAQELQSIQVANSVLSTRITRELNELGIASNTITKVLKIQSDLAVQEAQFEAQKAKARGESLEAGFSGLADLGFQAAQTPAIAGFFG